MPLTCPQCHFPLGATDGDAGGIAVCKECGERVPVPSDKEASSLPRRPDRLWEGRSAGCFWWLIGMGTAFGLTIAIVGGIFFWKLNRALTFEVLYGQGKLLTLALINIESRDQAYPHSYSIDRQGRPLLSWRVHILPYCEEQALYRQFHLDEPWDSPHNRTLIDKMPPIFRKAGGSLPPGHTCWLAVVGPRTAITKPRLQPDGSILPHISNRDILDGTSRTAVLVEVDDAAAVPWTKPADYEYDPRDPGRDLRTSWRDQIPLFFLDGMIGMVEKEVSDETLNAYFTRDARESRVLDDAE